MRAPSPKSQASSRKRSGLLLVACSLLLSSCGFHLRGGGTVEFPPALTTLRVVVADSQLANDPLLVAVKNALRTQAGVLIEEDVDVPKLVLAGERVESQVLSVGTTGKVSEYLLKYEVSFRLADAAGRVLSDPQTIKLQRDYRFDPLNVLAKEREEEDLKRLMRQDAASQIVRRLAKISFKPQASSDKPE